MEERRGMSEEERDQVSIDLLRNFWLKATQAFVDEVGSAEAIRILRPLFVAHGIAGGQILKEALSHTNESEYQGPISFEFTGGKVSVDFKERGTIVEIRDCATGGISREACACFCECTMASSAEDLLVGYEASLEESLSWGHPYCRFSWYEKEFKGNLGKTLRRIDGSHGNFEMKAFYAKAIFGEEWVMVTKAFIETVGEEKALKALTRTMRDYGNEFGRSLEEANGKDRLDSSIVEVVSFINQLFQKKSIESGPMNYEATECPFSGAPPAICLQFEAFFNGICKAVDPDCEFVYDSMMTKGEKSCRWVLRRKEKTSRPDPGPKSGLLKALTAKYLSGEITKQEYDEMKEIIEG